jgi:hypothetical protein
VGQRSFDLLPGHTAEQRRQGILQVNHVVQTAQKKSSVLADIEIYYTILMVISRP